MEEKEKYYAQVEAQLTRLDQSFADIKNKLEQRKENLPELDLDAIMKKHAQARAKLEELKQAEETTWESHKGDLDRMVADIDEDFRKALAYEVA